jgi:hypothetical protein
MATATRFAGVSLQMLKLKSTNVEDTDRKCWNGQLKRLNPFPYFCLPFKPIIQTISGLYAAQQSPQVRLAAHAPTTAQFAGILFKFWNYKLQMSEQQKQNFEIDK